MATPIGFNQKKSSAAYVGTKKYSSEDEAISKENIIVPGKKSTVTIKTSGGKSTTFEAEQGKTYSSKSTKDILTAIGVKGSQDVVAVGEPKTTTMPASQFYSKVGRPEFLKMLQQEEAAVGRPESLFYRNLYDTRGDLVGVRSRAGTGDIAQMQYKAVEQEQDMFGGTEIRAAEKTKWYKQPLGWLGEKADVLEQASEREKGSLKGQAFGLLALDASIAKGAGDVLFHPIRTTKQTLIFGKSLVTNPSGTGSAIGDELRSRPTSFLGETAGGVVALYGIGKVAPRVSARVGHFFDTRAELKSLKSAKVVVGTGEQGQVIRTMEGTTAIDSSQFDINVKLGRRNAKGIDVTAVYEGVGKDVTQSKPLAGSTEIRSYGELNLKRQGSSKLIKGRTGVVAEGVKSGDVMLAQGKWQSSFDITPKKMFGKGGTVRSITQAEPVIELETPEGEFPTYLSIGEAKVNYFETARTGRKPIITNVKGKTMDLYASRINKVAEIEVEDLGKSYEMFDYKTERAGSKSLFKDFNKAYFDSKKVVKQAKAKLPSETNTGTQAQMFELKTEAPNNLGKSTIQTTAKSMAIQAEVSFIKSRPAPKAKAVSLTALGLATKQTAIPKSTSKVKGIQQPVIKSTPMSSVGLVPKSITLPKSSQVPKNVLTPKSIVLPRQIQTPKQIQLPKQVLTPKQVLLPKTLVPPPPPPTTPPPFFKVKLPKQKKPKREKRLSFGTDFSPKYLPSLEAKFFSIKGAKPTAVNIAAGVAIRPILRKR